MIPPLLALGAWPFVVFALFARLKPGQALIWSILGGYLLLPIKRGFNIPGFPQLGKDIVPSLAALAAAAVVVAAANAAGRRDRAHILPGWWPRSPMAVGLILVLAVGTFGTIATNGDPLQYGPTTLSGLRLSLVPAYMISMLIPLVTFILARRFLGHPDEHRTLLASLAIGGLLYTLPALYEVRMSPRLNIDIYGYFQHHWNQMVRDGGFRPLVFLEHPLWLGLFLSTAILSALAFYRSGPDRRRGAWLAMAGWIFATLVLSKTLGALLVTLMLGPLILFTRPRVQLAAAALIAMCIMAYPALRGGGLVPIDQIVAVAERISEGRALSLETRLYHEDALLDKAQDRPLFGWSNWAGRNRIYAGDSGRDTTITDGMWIIAIGSYGWVGYLSLFGLLSGPIVFLALRARQYDVDRVTAGLTIVLAGNLIDLIPNAGLTPLTWMMAGALFGRLEYGRIADSAAVETSAPRAPRATRFGAFGQPAGVAGRQPDDAEPRYVRSHTVYRRGARNT